MKKFRKLIIPFVGGVLLAALLFLSSGLVTATPSVVPPEPTDCPDCQATQDLIDTEIVALELVTTELAPLMLQAETNLGTVEVELGSMGDVPAALTGHVELGNLGMGADCTNPDEMFPYYSVFSYDSVDYCFFDVAGFDSFYQGMWADIFQGTTLELDWVDLHNLLWDVLSDPLGFEDDDSDDLEDVVNILNDLFQALADCVADFCPLCPDCETIAADLAQGMLDLDDLEAEADLLDAELSDLETEIDDVIGQMEQLEALQDALRQMVEDAGGMTDADCDDFVVQPGQAWGIAHNFGDVQWCLTSESQIQDLIQNLEDYWQNNSSQHLPTEQQLSDQLDTLMDDYLLALDEYFDVLDLIEAKVDELAQLANDLEACLVELAALQDLGFCLDQDLAAMQALLDDVDAEMTEGYMPPEPEEPAGDGPEDAEGHWAEEFIDELFNADVISGDDLTGLFRPNDPINRAEASKIVTLGNGDETPPCDSFFDVFFDVEFGAWFCPFVDASYNNGYFEGYPDGSFGPAISILRAEAIAVVMRATGFDISPYSTYSFPDITGDEWFADYAEKAYQCGIVEGRDGLLVPGDDITRAEFAKIVDLAIFNDLFPWACDDYVCPDCDAIWDEVEALGAELDAIDATLDTLWADMQALTDLQDAFRQMVEDAGGMTDADCDGFVVQSGQAWGIAHNFGDVQWCLTSESQIQDLINNLDEYWQNNSSQHLPSEQQLQDDINQAMEDYDAKLDELLEKLGEYLECLDELEAAQAAGYCLE